MTPRFAAEVPPRNPIARSLALVVLSLALVGAVAMGALVFSALLGVLVLGYAISFVRAWWRLARIRRRAVFVETPQPQPEPAKIVEPELPVVEVVAADAAPRSTSDRA